MTAPNLIIDVSRYQDYIDWPLARAAGVTHAFIKATGEETAGPIPFKDGRFYGNWNMAKGLVLRGAYHFMDGGHGSASGEAEADFFCDTVEAAGGWGELRPAIDVEWPPKDGSLFEIEQLDACAERVARRCGVAPIIYTGRWYWDRISNVINHDWMRVCPLWIASYTAKCPDPPKPWQNVTLWQHTNKGRVNGIVGDVDMNRLVGDAKDLEL